MATFDFDKFLVGLKLGIHKRFEEYASTYGETVPNEYVDRIINSGLLMHFPEPVIELNEEYSFRSYNEFITDTYLQIFLKRPSEPFVSNISLSKQLHTQYTIDVRLSTDSVYIFYFSSVLISYNEIIDAMYNSCNLVISDEKGFLHRWVNRQLRISLESHDIKRFATLMEDKRLDSSIADDTLEHYLEISVNNGWGEVTMILLRKIEERRNPTELDLRL